MRPIKIPSTITKGKLEFKNRLNKTKISALPDGSYMLTIEKHSKRSNQQNRWIHGVLHEILHGLREAGYDEVKTVDDAKLIVKAMFFKKSYTNGLETIEVIEGTSEQDKTDFAVKADEIIRWASEYLGIDIAPPNTQLQFTNEF
jgi:hypothetical protein